MSCLPGTKFPSCDGTHRTGADHDCSRSLAPGMHGASIQNFFSGEWGADNRGRWTLVPCHCVSVCGRLLALSTTATCQCQKVRALKSQPSEPSQKGTALSRPRLSYPVLTKASRPKHHQYCTVRRTRSLESVRTEMRHGDKRWSLPRSSTSWPRYPLTHLKRPETLRFTLCLRVGVN